LEAVDQLLPVIETLDRQIGVISSQLKRLAREDEEAGLLTTIPGVGYYTALLLVAEIGDVERFPSPEKLCSYAGLVPSVRRSGNSTIHGSITKEAGQVDTVGPDTGSPRPPAVRHPAHTVPQPACRKETQTGRHHRDSKETPDSSVLDAEEERTIPPR